MKTNGGSLYDARSTALATGEQCTLCHGVRQGGGHQGDAREVSAASPRPGPFEGNASMYKPSERSWHRPLVGSALLTLALTGWAADSGTSAPHPALGAKKTAPAAAATKPLVDINSATQRAAEDTARHHRCRGRKDRGRAPLSQQSRPRRHEAIPAGRYLAIKRLIVAKQRGKPNGKA
jgi:hypothetical protein